jgi:uncharacterized protein (TIGR03437 family)
MSIISQGGVVNAAGLGNSTTIAPGSLISIFGTGLASTLATASSVPLSTSLADVGAVTINGTAAPLLFVSDRQINAQAPWELTPGSVNVVVTRGGVSSQPVAAQVTQFSPALYGFTNGTAQAIAVNLDGSIAAPAGAIQGVTSHPAMAGDTLVLYASGLGPVDQTPADGANSLDMLRQTTTMPSVLFGSVPSQVAFSGLSPQFVGVYQLNVVVPTGPSPGDAVPTQIQIGGVTSADALTIALQ